MKSNLVPLLAATLLALIGLLLVFGPLLHLLGTSHVSAELYFFRRPIRAVSVVSLPILGIILTYMSIFIYRRRYLAVLLSGLTCLLLLVYLLVLYPRSKITLPILLLNLGYFAIVVTRYKDFRIKNNFEGIAVYLRRIAIIAGMGFLYGVVGFYFFAHPLFRAHFSILTSIDLTLDSLTGFSGTIAEPTRLGQLFIDSLGGIGIVILVLLLNTLFRPLRMRFLPHRHTDHEKAAAIIKHSSHSSEDYFKLWPQDKQYYFSEDHEAFIAFKPSGRTVVILGDPVGDKRQFAGLVQRFIGYCASLGWSVAAINASAQGRRLYKKAGLSSIFIGNEGIVSTRKFTETTIGNKHFRYVANRAKRDHLAVEEWDDLTPERLGTLRNISRQWLARGKRREYSFFMGYFDSAYLQQCRIFVLRENGRVVGYINLIPSFFAKHESIDHLRSMGNISPVGMHYLLMKVIETLYSEGAIALNIGLAPLSGVEKSKTELLSRAVLRIVRLLGASYYSFQGLEQFKSKFEPDWDRQSLLYTGRPANLIGIARDIERASAYGSRGNRTLLLSTAVGIIVLTLGLYLMLA